MNRVAAKIAQEISVLLEHQDIDTRASQQETCHHPGRSAARDATLCLGRFPFKGRGHFSFPRAAGVLRCRKSKLLGSGWERPEESGFGIIRSSQSKHRWPSA